MDLLRRVVLGTILLASCACFPAWAQISPGELNKVHEALEGLDNCTACHERGAEVSPAKCLDCHSNISALIKMKHGMHSRSAGRPCTECHKDHLGRDALITRFSETTFDHTQTGFALSGKHKPLQCAKCHGEKKFRIEKAALPESDKKTYLGLKADCAACHVDRHNGTLGSDCKKCHNVDGFVPVHSFDHALAPFKLIGKHQQVLCAKCHPLLDAKPRPTPLVFTVASFGDCTPCHTSSHRAGFSARQCKDCHTPEGWKSTAAFDHSVTRFPLVGKHAVVTCEKCHEGLRKKIEGKKTDFSTKSSADCTPCHKSPHRQELSTALCTSCHSPVGWNTVKNQSFDHGLTGFPIRGKHTELACQRCHEAVKGTTSLADRHHNGKHRCADCHEDPHKGAFRERALECAACHRETGFVPSTFTMNEHSRSRFALTGAHAAVQCAECHRKEFGRPAFSFSSLQCAACHTDKHNGAFNSLMGKEGCAYCHSTERWSRVRFDHGKVGFSLAGKHTAVECSKCHVTVEKTVRYRGTPKECRDCHQEPHMNQFAGVSCAACHTPTNWRSLIFNHDTQSAFPLTGAHRRIACGACHRLERSERGTFIRFKPLLKTCDACHLGGKP
jgi:hypothetical protein